MYDESESVYDVGLYKYALLCEENIFDYGAELCAMRSWDDIIYIYIFIYLYMLLVFKYNNFTESIGRSYYMRLVYDKNT